MGRVSRRLTQPKPVGAFPFGPRPRFLVQIHLQRDLEEFLRAQGRRVPRAVTGEGFVDTGSTLTVVERERIETLGVEPVDTVNVSGIGGKTSCHVYPVTLALKDDADGPIVMQWSLQVVAAPLGQLNCLCLIGRDVLRRGVLVYDGVAGEVSFTAE
ncbi:MAG: hypothetical protein ACE149_10120 [Armatimonadota bacterium]